MDFRTAAFDLDNVYGRGRTISPTCTSSPTARSSSSGHASFTGGDPECGRPDANGENGRAFIGDPRNDENAIVSQLQGLFQRFHNRFVQDSVDLSFADVQQEVRFHYQFIVLNDFLPRIVHSDVLNALRTNGRFDEKKLKFYKPKNEPFMPVEFSVAAYRSGTP